ncbi:PIN domain-containing protein [Paucibacter sp. O1-1]|nr:PIN domain-containing protein [Paucibacter sp. O1-1]MDA3825642.1 PIN domain-containing protein [Paucibacter sp. O1-1]
MIAVDTGFIYALLDKSDAWHARAVAALPTAQEGWVTTWPVLTEATHLIGRRLGPRFAQALMSEVADGGLLVWDIAPARVTTIPALMRRYASLPMDLADASLVLLAEHLDHGRILTTDERDFGSYRWKSRKPFHNLLAQQA